ncbi:hypothetical protein [Nocardia sp. A7]|uniref:hypothetical protein n=1 Tax=Nocardia sp. A7 TaxID=2789274 RepID=UPI00397D5975
MIETLRKFGLLGPAGRLLAALVVVVVGLLAVVWVGNPFLNRADPDRPAAWTMEPPPPPRTTSVVPPPPGFPTMEFPPPMPSAEPGRPQLVPTRFGLSYAVPSGKDWKASNQLVFGWSDRGGQIATFGAGSQFRRGYCGDDDGADRAMVGMSGRNGVDLDTAAREAVTNAELVFADDETGRKPRVEITGPFDSTVSGQPARRYTATVSEIPETDSCSPDQAVYEIIATTGYASAEVALLLVTRDVGTDDALPAAEAETILQSLQKTDK